MPRVKRSTDATGGGLRLTPEDVERLLKSGSASRAKIDITEKMGGTYARGGFNPREAAIAEQVFRLLARDMEVAVRAMLAEQLKSSSRLPRDIAMAMARDVAEEVALPVLRYCEALSEDDLVILVRETRETLRHIAIGEREHVSERVSEALLHGGVPEVAQTLAGNAGAALSEAMLEIMLARFSGAPGVMRSLARRPNLPVAIAEKMVAHVSASLAKELRKKYKLEEQHLADEEQTARSSATLALLKNKHGQDEMDKLIMQLSAFNRLTPDLLISALSEGYLHFFESGVGKLAGIPTESARRLIHDHGDLGFRAIYNQAGLPPASFEQARQSLQKALATKAAEVDSQ